LCQLIIKETRRQTVIVSDDDAKGRRASVVFRRSSLANLQHVKPDIPANSKIDLSLFPCMQTEVQSKNTQDQGNQASTIAEQKPKSIAKPNAKLNANTEVKPEVKVDVKTLSD